MVQAPWPRSLTTHHCRPPLTSLTQLHEGVAACTRPCGLPSNACFDKRGCSTERPCTAHTAGVSSAYLLRLCAPASHTPSKLAPSLRPACRGEMRRPRQPRQKGQDEALHHHQESSEEEDEEPSEEEDEEQL